MAEAASGKSVSEVRPLLNGREHLSWGEIICTTWQRTRPRRRPPPQGFIRKYIFSVDHEVIGNQYTTLSLVTRLHRHGAFLWIMRIHLGWPNASIPLLGILSPTGAPGGVPTPEYYLSLMTMHGTIMAFFVLTAAPMAGYGNFMLPISRRRGGHGLSALEGMASFWVTFVGFALACATFVVPDRPPLSEFDHLRAAKRCGSSCGSGTGVGPELWGLSIVALRGVAIRLAELHRDRV